MKAAELYTSLSEKGVMFWIESDKLRYRAPKGILSPALRNEITLQKQDIIALLQDSDTNSSLPFSPLVSISRDGELPLSFIQERLWFLDQFSPGSRAYNIPLAFEIAGPLDVESLEKSINEIIGRHEVIRTACKTKKGKPILVIESELNLALPVVNLAEFPENKKEARMLHLATEAAKQPFDLGESPLLRTTLYRLNKELYVLLITMHHFIADGWSIGIFYNELSILYQSYISGEPSQLPELQFQYVDFSHWQRERYQGEFLENELEYWTQRLDKPLATLDMPTDYPRSMALTYRGTKQTFTISKNLLEALKELSREESVTLFMTLLAGLQTLLHRYTHQDDIVVGTHVSNRTRIEKERLIGSFANSLVLRTDFVDSPAFIELLNRVRLSTLEDYAHQELPFEKLVEVLQPERDMSRSPLFQVSIILHQRTQDQRLHLSDLTTSYMPIDIGTSRYDLSFDMVEVGGDLLGTVEYNTDLFNNDTITRFCDHFKLLLQSIVDNPEEKISRLPLMTAFERHQLLLEWNDTQRAYTKDLCIHELFENQVENTPDSKAVVFDNEALTYQDLNRKANQLAHYLQALGVERETLVGIYLERSMEMIIGLLGVLKAGGTYVPLDPTFPNERLAFMVQDANISVLLTQKKLVHLLPKNKAEVICLDAHWSSISLENHKNPEESSLPNDLCYMIYTSGSTGRPKGVQITHSAVVNFLHHMQGEPGLNKRDSLLAITTISFDIAALELFLPLSVGARLVLTSHETASDAVQLTSKLSESGATVMQATPATWRMLVDSGWEGKDGLKIICGGEALSRELADQLLQRGGEVWNLYGPTETTIWSTILQVDRREGAVSIGSPIANTECYVLDNNLEPRPIGVHGELFIGGDGLSRGYFNRPGLTAEKFIPNPFSEKPGTTMYRTGDLTRYLPDGNIEYLGRIDNQVKVRGYRIELGEIEAVLSQHQEVREAVVVAREDIPGDQRLVAYLVPNKDSEPSIEELRDYLGVKLPDYMLPSSFVVMESLPLTPNDKIDRNALPEPDWSRPNLEHVYIAPRTPEEEQLAGIWGEFLGLDHIGIRDNFFDLGGHSLLATRVLARLRDAFQVELPLRIFFETPTVASLTESIKTIKWAVNGKYSPDASTKEKREEWEL